MLRASPRLVRRLLRNLLENARRHGAEFRARLVHSVEQKQVAQMKHAGVGF